MRFYVKNKGNLIRRIEPIETNFNLVYYTFQWVKLRVLTVSKIIISIQKQV